MAKKKKKKTLKKAQEMLFGFPKTLIMKQPLIDGNTKFLCKKCGQEHILRDGSDEFPEAAVGDVMIYNCGDQLYIGGILNHFVVGLESTLAPYYQMVFLLTDLLVVTTPDQEEAWRFL